VPPDPGREPAGSRQNPVVSNLAHPGLVGKTGGRQKTSGIGRVVLVVGSVKAGEALSRDAEFVALRVLHYGPALAGYLVFADERGTKPD
jgi:hypothetical protein